MKQAFDRLAAEYRDNRACLFEALKSFVWGEKSGDSYREIAATLESNEGQGGWWFIVCAGVTGNFCARKSLKPSPRRRKWMMNSGI